MQWGARHLTMSRRSAFALSVAAWPLPTAAVIARHYSLAWLAAAAWFAFVVVGTLALRLVTLGPKVRGAHAAGRAPALLGRAAATTEERIRDVSDEPDAVAAQAFAAQAFAAQAYAAPAYAAEVDAAELAAAERAATDAYTAEASAAERMPGPTGPPVFFASWDHEVTDPTSGFPPGGEPVEVTVGLARLEAFANSGRPPRR
jgi:hypothetical protein